MLPNDTTTAQADDALADFDNPAPAEEAASAPAEPSGESGSADVGQDEAELDKEDLAALAAGTDSDGPMIPKPRFDEATGKLKDEVRTLREELDSVKAQQRAATLPVQSKDFAAARADLKAKLEASEIDDDQYEASRDALLLEEAEHRAVARLTLAQAEASRRAAEASWDAKQAAWAERNAKLLSIGSIDSSVRAFLENADPNLSDDELLNQAEAHMHAEVDRLRSVLLGDSAPTRQQEPPTNPHVARNAADAFAQGRASSAPNPAAGGAGDRGRGSFPGILDLKDKDFNALPKDVRESKSLADF